MIIVDDEGLDLILSSFITPIIYMNDGYRGKH